MDNWPGWTTRFELMYRQEQSRHASGRTRVKDFGTPIWRASYQSRLMRPNEVDQWRARLAALENGLLTYRAWPMSRCWPIKDPNGTILTGGGGITPGFLLDFVNDDGFVIPPSVPGEQTVGSIGSDNKSLSILGLPSMNYLSVGDYLEINDQWLHQVTSVDGIVVGVAPHLSVGVLSGQTVNLHQPSVTMALVPGSVSTATGLNGRASISFEAMEARG